MEAFVEGFAKHGYLAVFLLMLAETVFPPIPSEVTMPFAGFLASPDRPLDAIQLNFFAVALAGVLGNVVGSWFWYGVGWKLGRAPLDRYGKYVGVKPADLDKVELWWGKHGTKAVLFGRLIPMVRAFISLPAGIERMPLGRFTVFSALGFLPWVFALTAVGYLLGENWNAIVGEFNLASYVIAGLILVAGAAYLIRRRRAERHPPAE
ncbi:MAG: DedA family protein [Actinomycetota bacterium]